MISLVKIFFTFATIVTICNCAAVTTNNRSNNNYNNGYLTSIGADRSDHFVEIITPRETFTGIIVHANYTITQDRACTPNDLSIKTFTGLDVPVLRKTPNYGICIIKTDPIPGAQIFTLRKYGHHLKKTVPMTAYDRNSVEMYGMKLKSEDTRQKFNNEANILGVQLNSKEAYDSLSYGSALIYVNKKEKERLVAVTVHKLEIEGTSWYLAGIELCLKDVATFIKINTDRQVKCR